MMCVHCEATIQKALAAIGAKGRANSLSKEVVVTYGGDKLSDEAVRQAIIDAGYTIQ